MEECCGAIPFYVLTLLLESYAGLLQLRVLGIGLAQDGDVWVARHTP